MAVELVAEPVQSSAEAGRPATPRRAHAPGGRHSGSTGARAFLLLVLAAGCALGLAPLLMAPAPEPASAPATTFSAERAMGRLRVIAAEPHPMGSPAHAAVERYLVEQLTAMGVETEVQEATSLRLAAEYGRPNVVLAGRVRNVVARVPGTASTGTILLAGTYDAMPTTTGAADNGAGVATILEALRALRSGPPLANDLVILLGDAEVNGLFGETAFLDEHPWARDVRLAVTFGAMGTHGPTLPIATSRDSARLVDAVADAPHPLVDTWVPELARAVGQGGAALAYIERGADTLLLASVAGWPANHTQLDNLHALDRRGLQQSGENALALVRAFGSQDLRTIRAPDQVGLTVFPYQVIRYPGGWAPALAGLDAMLLVGALALGFRRRRLTAGGLALGILAFPLALFFAVALTAGGWWVIRALNESHAVFLAGTFGIAWYLLGFVALTFALFALVYGWLGGRTSLESLSAGVLLWWAVLAGVTSASFPSASAIFAWPLLAATLLLGWMLLAPTSSARPWPRAVGLGLAALPPLVLATPLVYLLLALTDKLAAMRGLPLLAVPVAVVALVAGLLVPHLAFLQSSGQRARWILPGVVGLAGVLLLGLGWRTSAFDAGQPRPDYLAYALDADAGTAHWIGTVGPPDAWTGQVFQSGTDVERISFAPSPNYFPNRQFPARRAPAPAMTMVAPELTVIEDTISGGARSIRLRVASARGANALQFTLQAPGPIRAAAVDGKPVDVARGLDGARDRLQLVYSAPPPDGLELAVAIEDTGPIAGRVEDYSNGLPSAAGLAPRPADTMPAVFDFADPTIVARTVTLPAGGAE